MKTIIMAMFISVNVFGSGHWVPSDNQASKTSWTSLKSCLKINSACVDIKVEVDAANAQAKVDKKIVKDADKVKKNSIMLSIKSSYDIFDDLKAEDKDLLLKLILESILIRDGKLVE